GEEQVAHAPAGERRRLLLPRAAEPRHRPQVRAGHERAVVGPAAEAGGGVEHGGAGSDSAGVLRDVGLDDPRTHLVEEVGHGVPSGSASFGCSLRYSTAAMAARLAMAKPVLSA
ncbi:MAG: hypothetical protein ACK559_36080, partial [bacterium]